MNGAITSTSHLGDHPQGSPQRDPEERGKPSVAESQTSPDGGLPDVRLVIEREDGEDGGFLYKTIDARTGRIIHAYQRDQLLSLRDEADYHAGDVIRAQA